MLSRLLADENVDRPLVRLLRSMGLDVVWLPETTYRGISDKEVINLANNSGRVILTRDSDFLKVSLRMRAKYGIIYIAEPVRKDNVKELARNVNKALEIIKRRTTLAIITSTTIELHPLVL